MNQCISGHGCHLFAQHSCALPLTLLPAPPPCRSPATTLCELHLRAWWLHPGLGGSCHVMAAAPASAAAVLLLLLLACCCSGMAWHGTAWHCSLHGMAWHGTACRGTAWQCCMLTLHNEMFTQLHTAAACYAHQAWLHSSLPLNTASPHPTMPPPPCSYTPLLPAMCAGTVEERSIVEPVRAVLGGKASVVWLWSGRASIAVVVWR